MCLLLLATNAHLPRTVPASLLVGAEPSPDPALLRQVSGLTSELSAARARLEAFARQAEAREAELARLRQQLADAQAQAAAAAEAALRPRTASLGCQAALPDPQVWCGGGQGGRAGHAGTCKWPDTKVIWSMM